MTSRAAVAVLLSLGLLGACGDRDTAPRAAFTPTPDGATLYETTGLVLEKKKGAPELCLGAVQESYPPQCDGLALVGWDWDAVEAEETAAGQTWGEFHLTGSFEGETFTVVDAGPPEPFEAPPDGDHFATPCPEPPGGWTSVDPSRDSEEDVSKVAQAVNGHPDYAGLWIDRVDGHVIVNAAFTGSLERHEAEIRELWGGPLCVTQRDVSYRDLRAIQDELGEDPDIDVLWTDVDEVEGKVLAGVVVLDDETRARLDERYGAGAVEVHPQLRPVE